MPSSCGTCSKENVTFFCSRCRDTYYCNVRCQRKNWKQHKTQCYRYKLNQDVALRVIKINGKVTWVDAEVTKLLPCSQYQITIDNFIFRTNPFIDKNIVIASENELRPSSNKLSNTLNLEQQKDILDLYLEGRDCKQELKALMNQIKYVMTAPYFVDYETAQFLSINILEYLFENNYKWRISCFWCNESSVKMEKQSARARCISMGAHTLFDYVNELSIYIFCDECNDKMHYDDMIYGCDTLEHDICLKCVYKKKIISYNDLMENVIPILTNFVDINCAREIIEFVAGCVIQFK